MAADAFMIGPHADAFQDREQVVPTGADLARILRGLVACAGQELTVCYYQTILQVNVTGRATDPLRSLAEEACIEDRRHFEALATRIVELGGRLPARLGELQDAAVPGDVVRIDPTDREGMLRLLIRAKHEAIRAYTQLCGISEQADPRTRDICLAILHEDIEHENWFSRYRDARDTGPCRKGRPQSPYVRKFLSVT